MSLLHPSVIGTGAQHPQIDIFCACIARFEGQRVGDVQSCAPAAGTGPRRAQRALRVLQGLLRARADPGRVGVVPQPEGVREIAAVARVGLCLAAVRQDLGFRDVGVAGENRRRGQ